MRPPGDISEFRNALRTGLAQSWLLMRILRILRMRVRPTPAPIKSASKVLIKVAAPHRGSHEDDAQNARG